MAVVVLLPQMHVNDLLFAEEGAYLVLSEFTLPRLWNRHFYAAFMRDCLNEYSFRGFENSNSGSVNTCRPLLSIVSYDANVAFNLRTSNRCYQFMWWQLYDTFLIAARILQIFALCNAQHFFHLLKLVDFWRLLCFVVPVSCGSDGNNSYQRHFSLK